MIHRIDHLGVAVKDLEAAIRFYTEVLGLSLAGREELQGLKVAFIRVGDDEIELIEDTTPDGPIARYIARRGEGIQHVAFAVPNIQEALQAVKARGVRVIDEVPRRGTRGAEIAFLHPQSTHGVLIEFCAHTHQP
ncbi:MAG: methylmalonyl-CoA epimerase [Nitrospinota bacterium]|nr:MAG: methylmalonyl-CoA epimerase [Nitrospinota bacterium]